MSNEALVLVASEGLGRRMTRPLARLASFVRRKPLGGFGLAIVIAALVVAFAGPWVAPQDPFKTRMGSGLEGPSASHWFGTDHLGRDVFSRTIYGTKVSIYVGVATTLIATAVGLALGVSSAYFSGRYDLSIQRVVDGLAAIPTLLLALALVSALRIGMENVIIALSITTAPRIVRVVRSGALSVMANPYVDAARTIGAGSWRIMVRHIAPNVFAPLLIISSAAVGAIITAESTLSFLGVGVPYATISWGGLMGGDTRRLAPAAPWLILGPGAALTLVVFGINVFADALRDVLDPKLRGR